MSAPPRLSRFTARWLLERAHEQLVGTGPPVLPELSHQHQQELVATFLADRSTPMPSGLNDETPEQRDREVEAWRLLADEARAIALPRPQAPPVSVAAVPVRRLVYGVGASVLGASGLGSLIAVGASEFAIFGSGVVLGHGLAVFALALFRSERG